MSKPNLSEILINTCNQLGVSYEEIKGVCRKRPLSEARCVYAFKAYQNGYTLEKIGKEINRDHSTITHYLKLCNAGIMDHLMPEEK